MIVQATKPERDHDRSANEGRIVNQQLGAKTGESAKCTCRGRTKRKFCKLVENVRRVGVALMVVGIHRVFDSFYGPRHCAMFTMGFMFNGTDPAPVHTSAHLGLES